jgi:uncharacterized protein YdeI (YjbR/CyaY-like superfamily)
MTTKSAEPILSFASTAEWRAWLKTNHLRSRGVLLRIGKGATKTISYAEALDAALAWGWIDSRKQALDAGAWLQRFTPRTAKSPWSKINVEVYVNKIQGTPLSCGTIFEVDWALAEKPVP